MANESETFRSLDLPRVIDTSEVDFVEEFYDPLLSRSVEYKRGVGYFTVNWLKSASRGIAKLAENGGTAKWIMSPQLEAEDWKAIRQGQRGKDDERLRAVLADRIRDLRYDLEYRTRNAIAWMIADGLLEIRFAIPNEELGGDFHDKFGIFRDGEGNKVAFHGSQNDSAKAFENYEAYTIDCSWIGERDAEGVALQEQRFEAIWSGTKSNLDVFTIPEGIAEEIADLRDEGHRPYADPTEEGGIEFTLREYQQEAVDAWRANDYRGLFEMATGTGKTFTAIGALDSVLSDQTKPAFVVVAVPVTHLAQQWADELQKWGYSNPEFLYGSANNQWKEDLSQTVSDIGIGIGDHRIVLTTHTTLASEYFREQLRGGSFPAILIADEVHRLGSEHQRKGLLPAYKMRIGLSATPERYYDEEGSKFLIDYFDDVVFKYSLEQAIPEYLTPYDYHPIIVEMTAEELEEYEELSRKLATAAGREDTDDEIAERLAMKRAEIVKSAENKYSRLQSTLRQIGEPDHLLVYTNPQQIDYVQEILNEVGIRQHKFTYEEDDDERERLLEAFDKGEYDALVAMRCLDEGVDVPSTRQAILMSNSGNPMQFIQRRGRVLRKHPGKRKAIIYDFLVVPTMNPESSVVEAEKAILQKELRRFEEFVENARNEFAARNAIERVRTEYGLAGDESKEEE